MKTTTLGMRMENKSAENVPTVLIIFGGTGDLMAKKVLPALYHLFEKDKLPVFFRVFGVARKELSDSDYRNFVKKVLEEHKDTKSKGILQIESFIELFFYHRGFVKKLGDYEKLALKLGLVDNEWKTCSNKLFFLGVPPNLYESTLRNLAKSGLTKPCGPKEGWTRVIIEKPFGRDLKSARRLCRILCGLFKQEQLYLIDHYLGKEMIQNILFFRFANSFFEGFWNNKFVDHIEVRLLEDIGVEGRGKFYDSVGALRDVGQNHLLQMLALTTMDNPVKFEPEAIRLNRAKILEKLRTLTEKEISQLTFRAQYNGYREIEGAQPNSATETYFKILAFLDSPRWQGVPIVLESGKRLEKPKKEVIVHLKHPTPCLCPKELEEHLGSRIVFSLEPKESIEMYLQSKEPGFGSYVGEKGFNCVFKEESRKTQYVEEYEKLLFDCITGDQTFFVSMEEIEASWRFIDPILNAWKKGLVPLVYYEPGKNLVLSESKIVEQKMRETTTLKKEIGIVGLGKMGSNLAFNLIDKGWRVVGFNRTYEVTKGLEEKGIVGAATPKEIVSKNEPPRVIWVMVKAGEPVDGILFGEEGLMNYLENGDIVIDGGNSFYEDSVRRAHKLAKKGITFVDVGISGGPEGARTGACLIVGGTKEAYEKLLPLYLDISVAQGVQFFEGVGAGHFVKMVHNGIEYGIMQAIAEGFTVLKNAAYSLNLKNVAEVYNHGSVIESRLIGWLKKAFEVHGVDLKDVSGTVAHTGEGEWAVNTARGLGVKAKIIEEAVNFRIESEKNPSYTGKILSALREQFGGHSIIIRTADEKKRD
jgi:glucose-6-phosphate 1-dehydrogenase